MPCRKARPFSLRSAHSTSAAAAAGQIRAPTMTSATRRISPPIADELHQRAVRIAEIDAGAVALGAEALHWPGLDHNVVLIQVRDGVIDRSAPFEAQIAV